MARRLVVKKAKIWKTGNSYVVSIPKQLVLCGAVKLDSPVNFMLEQESPGIRKSKLSEK